MMMELAWLEDFAALADTGNFSRAAEQRHVTQPSFSRRIKALEDWIGTPLFERRSNGTALTHAGELFRPDAEEMIRRLRQAREAARQAGGKDAAMLCFVATHSLSFKFFPQWIRTFDTRTTLGPIRLISESMQGCEQVMLHGEAQFLLCHYHKSVSTSFDNDQYSSAHVGDDVLVPLTVPDDAGAPRWALDGTGAAPVPYLGYSAESGLGRIIDAELVTRNRAGRLDRVFTSHLAAALLSVALGGQGVAWLPQSLADRELQRGALVRAGDEQWDVPVEVRLIRPRARQSETAEALWSLVTVRSS